MNSFNRVLCAGLFVSAIGLAQISGFAHKRGSDASSRAEVASLAQHIIARTYVNPVTGEGFACLWFPFLHGIPESILFSGASKSETTARFTARFTNFQAEPLPANGDMVNALFSAGHEVRFYYKENPALVNQNWNNPDAFNSGLHVATFTTRRNLLNQIGTVAFFVNSAPLTFSRDFEAADGKIYNFRDLSPGGITVHVLASTTPIISPATAPFVVQLPFSGTGIVMGGGPSQ